jgi:dihydrofolate reductase
MYMRRVRYNVATSVDGFIASPDGSTDWIIHDPSIDFPALYAQFDTFVMGRKTYETLLAFGELNPLRDKPPEQVIVASRMKLRDDEHSNITVLNEKDVLPYVAELKSKEGRDIWAYGGGQLVRCLLEGKLVDMIEVAIMPVVLGSGVKMVANGDDGNGWKLVLDNVEKLESGILMCKYHVLYRVRYGQLHQGYVARISHGQRVRCRSRMLSKLRMPSRTKAKMQQALGQIGRRRQEM